ncbi:unnamed protein product, partial [Leptidea sinapis]
MQSLSCVAQSGALLASISLLLITNGVNGLVTSGLSNYSFPDNFMLGVATAAFQIEGAWNEGGKGESMWDTFLHKNPDFTLDRSNGDVAADSYHKYKQDIIMVQSLGVKYYRLSISWPRLFKELRKAKINPVVTLFHWDLPTPLMDLGGWSNPKMADFFVDYARVAFTLFGDLGYGRDYFVPAIKFSGVADYLCSHNMLLGHAKVYHLYDKKFKPRQK